MKGFVFSLLKVGAITLVFGAWGTLGGAETSSKSYLPAKVALVQYTADLHFGDKETNQSNLTGMAEEAVSEGAKVIVFPEGSLLVYEEHPNAPVYSKERKRTWCRPGLEKMVTDFRREVTCVDPTELAENVPDGESTLYWSQFSMKHNVYLVFSILERVQQGETQGLNPDEVQFANTTVVVGPEGFIAKHRKGARWQNEVYLQTVLGDKATIFETPYGKFGVSICLGVVNDKIFETYQKEKVSAVLFPADWVEKDYGGCHGGSKAESFDTFAAWRKLDFLAADDNGSSRTGYYRAVQNKQGEFSAVISKKLDSLGEDKILFVEIDY